MNQFYTNVALRGQNVLLRYIEDGVRKKAKIPYKPKLYLPAAHINETKFKTLFGHNLEPMKFDTMYEAREFVKKYDGVPNFKIYGHTQFEYAFISDEYPGEIKYDTSKVKIGYIDIEVGVNKYDSQPNKMVRIRKKIK